MRKVLFVASLLAAFPLGAQQSPRWFATWAPSHFAAPAPPPRDSVDRVPTYVDRTVRQIVRSTLGGDRVRIRLTNEYGDGCWSWRSAHRHSRLAPRPVATDRAIMFAVVRR
jgi:hypothetical protein